ncbi:MAG: GNAT family N-acetyltransferase [Burkholderiales bacterium]|nr:GNAT family N-acetyltransferase [Burkholderiales bacterium]
MNCAYLYAETETKTLVLRMPVEADIEAVMAVYGDPATQTYNPMGAMASREAAEHMLWRWRLHWIQHGFGIWAIADAADPARIIGFGGVAWREEAGAQRLSLHAHLLATETSQGVATAVGSMALACAAHKAAGAPVHAGAVAANTAAITVIEKLGFELSGTSRTLPWSPIRIDYQYLAPAMPEATPVVTAGRVLKPTPARLVA